MQVLAAKRPAAVVATHPWPATVIARARHEGIATPPTLLVATDFSLHPQWVQPGLDHYCVPTQDAAALLMQGGIPAARITVTGIPIHRAFQGLEHQRPDVPTVLLVGSAQGGLGGVPVACKRMLLQIAPARLEVVVGADRWLKNRLQQRRTFRRSDRFVVHGYVPDLSALLCHADVVVTKGGGVTLAEALATGIPLVVYRAIPGHEVDNAAWLEREGAALVARHPAELAADVASLLANPERCRSLAAHARRLARPRAADDVADLAMGLLQGRSRS
jgi:processive 1,2-diacylglycerol beta-glucosyltransferase